MNNIVRKIKRQAKHMKAELLEMYEYDKIVNMEWEGIPGLKSQEYYVEYVDTAGRDILQQATNVYAISRPKWDVLPRGKGDVKVAEAMERIIEWHFWKASQFGSKPYHSEAMTHIGKYNKACGQLEWMDDGFFVRNHDPKTVIYEYGFRLNWVAIRNNVDALDIIELWSDYAKSSEIGVALKKLENLIKDNENNNQFRMMYVDYTDNKKRYTYCYPVQGYKIDETLGYGDDGQPVKDMIVIQDKDNSLGFINFAIAENEGDPLLAPLYRGKYYDNINDLETMKATTLFRRGLFPMFIQQGREDADAQMSFTGEQPVLKSPPGANLTPVTPPPLDPGYNEMAAQMRSRMNASLAVQNVSQAQVSNVQHSTYNAQVKMWLMQFEPNKRTAEKYYERLAYLMFLWAKKKEKVLYGTRRNSSKYGVRGGEVSISPEDINFDDLYIKCNILANNPTDVLQLANQITMFKQAGIRIPDSEYVERLDMGDPDILEQKYENQEIRSAVLNSTLKTIVQEADMAMEQFRADLQKQMVEFQAMIQMQIRQQVSAQGQVPMEGGQGQVPLEQGNPLPSDEAMSGAGFNAASGGMPPQAGGPEITQGMR